MFSDNPAEFFPYTQVEIVHFPNGEAEPFTQYPKITGPDRSIQLQSFQTGQVRPSRYRNRRLGDFLKELDLTEGKATGIPTVFKELKKNGSPEPRFNTDDDRTFFEVELFIHPSFKTKSPFTTDLSKINWNLAGHKRIAKPDS